MFLLVWIIFFLTGGEGLGGRDAASQVLDLDLDNLEDLVEMLNCMEEYLKLWPWGQWIPEIRRDKKQHGLFCMSEFWV